MYCKKCRKLLKDSSLVCPSCGFDNNNEFNIEKEFKNLGNEEKKYNFIQNINLFLIF